MKNYEIYSKSIRNRKDEPMQNGDYILHRVLDDENLVYLSLSDGVGSTACFWVASKIICENTYKYFIEYDFDDKSIESRLQYAIEKANSDILSYEFNKCKGMLATLCIVVWDRGENKIYFTSIGDSRIYKYNTVDGLKQLTKDQMEYVKITQNGKPVFINGTLATRKLITNSVGQEQPIVDIFTTDFNEGEAITISSDGFYEVIDADDELPKLFANINLKSAFKSIMGEVESINIDDASVVILRRNDVNQKSNNFESLPSYLKVEAIISNLQKALENNNEKEAEDNLIKLFEMDNGIGKNNYIEIMNVWNKSDLFKNNNLKINAYLIKLRNLVKV